MGKETKKKKEPKKNNAFKKTIKALLILIVLGALFVVISNLIIVNANKSKMVSDEELKELKADCILILGAGVWDDGKPSPILADRLDEGARLYKENIAEKILVSGDHGQTNYDEVNAMKKYLTDAGVPGEDVFMDHAGFSTYESIYRAKEVFGVEKLIVVTQEYHMYRALYICEKLGLTACGASADPREYAGALMRNAREMIARDKDVFTCLFKPKPTYLGDPVDIHGDGNVTNDNPAEEQTFEEESTVADVPDLPEEKPFDISECCPITEGDRYIYNPFLLSQEFRAYYSEEEARFYRDFLTAYLNHETACRCPGEKASMELITILDYECPFYAWADIEYVYALNYDEEHGLITWTYNVSAEEITARFEQVKKAVQEFLDLIPVSMTDEPTRVQTLYHAFCPLMTYDYEGRDSRLRIDNCYVFTEHRGICVSFSDAFAFLLESIGMKTTLATGITTSGEAHVWNTVNVDGNDYYFDTTFELNYRGGTAYVYYGMNAEDRANNGVYADNQNHGRYSYIEPALPERHLNAR